MTTTTTTTTDNELEAKAHAIRDELAHCTGGDELHRHWLGIRYTDGIMLMAERCQAYWLIDAIASHQTRARRNVGEGLQVWILKVNREERTAMLRMAFDIANGKPIKRGGSKGWSITQRIPFTDFPLDGETKIYVSDRIMLLPSEY